MPNYIKTKLNDITNQSKNLTDLEFLLEVLPPLSENGPWIAGGSLLRTYINLPLNTDVDIFFKNAPQYDEYCIKINNISKNSDGDFVITDITKKKWHTTYTIIFKNNTYKLQLVNMKFFDNICGVLDSFDMNICQLGFDGKNLFHAENCLNEIKEREIKIETVNFPQLLVKRLLKYNSLGFKVSDKEINNLFFKCSKLPNFGSLVQKSTIDDDDDSYEAIQ